MANVLYPAGKSAFLRGEILSESDTFRCVAVTSAYVYNAAHEYLVDIDAGARVFNEELEERLIQDGVFTAYDFTSAAVPSGSTIAALVVCKYDVAESAAQLIAFIDHDNDGNPISVPTNNADVGVVWPTGHEVFAL